MSRLLRMGRNTVARYTELLGAAGLLDGEPSDLPTVETLRRVIDGQLGPVLRPGPRSSIERWLPIVDAKFEQGVGPTAIYDFLRLEHEDFEGSLSAIKRRCAALRRNRAVRPEEVTMPVETEPGDVAQVDFGYVGKL